MQGIGPKLSPIAYQVVDKLEAKGYPVEHPLYPDAHSEALQAEKKMFSKDYPAVKKLSATWPKGTLMGDHDAKGNLYVSKDVPEQYRQEVAYHEQVEHKALLRLIAEHSFKNKYKSN